MIIIINIEDFFRFYSIREPLYWVYASVGNISTLSLKTFPPHTRLLLLVLRQKMEEQVSLCSGIPTSTIRFQFVLGRWGRGYWSVPRNPRRWRDRKRSGGKRVGVLSCHFGSSPHLVPPISCHVHSPCIVVCGVVSL